MTASLVVEVVDIAGGTRAEYTFGQSPVRIGRSPLNELPIDRSFVSHCHGVIQFDRLRCEFVDLGSTNGSYLGDKRLAPNEPVPMGPGTQIAIGTLNVSARRGQANSADTRGTYAFRRSELQPKTGEPSQLPVASGVRAPTEVDAAALSGALRRALPQLFVAGTEGRLVERLLEALDRFAEAFLELRRGQQQLAQDLSLPSAASSFASGLDASDLIFMLVDPRRTTEPLDELSRAHADLMLHQVALINAFRAGARAVLDELSPDAIEPEVRGPLAWLGRLFGRDARWDSLRRRVDELREETALSSVLFGKSFVRAYAATVGASDNQDASPEERTGKL